MRAGAALFRAGQGEAQTVQILHDSRQHPTRRMLLADDCALCVAFLRATRPRGKI